MFFFEAIWLIRDWMTNWWIVYWHSPFFGNSPSFITLPHLWIMVSSMLQVERGTTALSVVRYPTISQLFCQQLVNWWFGGPGGLDLLMSQRLGIPPWNDHISPSKVGTFGAGDFPNFPFGWDTLQGTNIFPKNGILKMIFLFPRWDMLIPWRVCGCSPGGYLGTTHLWGQGLPQTRRPAGLDGDYPGATGPGIHIREIGGVGGGKFIPFDLKWRKQNNWLNIFEDFYCWSIVFFV